MSEQLTGEQETAAVRPSAGRVTGTYPDADEATGQAATDPASGEFAETPRRLDPPARNMARDVTDPTQRR